MPTSDEYLFSVRKYVDALKAHSELPEYQYAQTEQNKVKQYFMLRAADIGEAAFRVGRLDLAQMIFARVLCEDFIQFFWASQSANRATQFSEAVLSELVRAARSNIIEGRAQFRDKKTGQDHSKRILDELDKKIVPRLKIQEMAADCGLAKIYDIVYRFGSLPVHAKTFDIVGYTGASDEATLVAPLSAIAGFLRVTLDVVEKPVSAQDVLRRLGLEKIGGK
jgi:hypothetical protein